MDHNSECKRHMETSYGEFYMAAVERFQDGFEKDLHMDRKDAFNRAVETCSRATFVFKAQEKRVSK